MRFINFLIIFFFLGILGCVTPEDTNAKSEETKRSDFPVTQNASVEAKSLLTQIYNLDGQILTGQHCYSHEPNRFYERVHEITGKHPAIWGADFYWAKGEVDPGFALVPEIIKKHEQGAIITLMWHVGKPNDVAPFSWRDSVQGEITDEEWKDLLTPGTPTNLNWQTHVDRLADHLKVLQKNNIPILWRPYHEMNGVWFWWGDKKGKEGYQALWKMLYHRLVDHHQLNNLIWVWNANAPRDIPFDQAFSYQDYYPGHDYVDILATDVYHFDYEQDEYEELLALAEGKPIALGEVGQLPKVNILEAQPEWSWFMVWSQWLETANSEDRVKEIYEYDKAISRK